MIDLFSAWLPDISIDVIFFPRKDLGIIPRGHPMCNINYWYGGISISVWLCHGCDAKIAGENSNTKLYFVV